MKNANLSFKGQIPFNEEFGDIYFNADKPWLESEFVFASALDEIWQSKDSFIVAETGFGAGRPQPRHLPPMGAKRPPNGQTG